MPEEQSSYRQIMKATSIFGGVQVFNIIISIIRSKFVAVLLGPGGMGIYSLLTSTTSFVEKLTNLGLSTSAVRNVAAANSSGDNNKIAVVVGVLKRLVWITGIVGAVFTLAFAPWLSEVSFGNKEYTVAFIWIAITLLFAQLTSGNLVILQGMRQLKHLAKANLIGSTLALFITIPMYYLWNLKGIVPAIIISAFITLVLSWHFSSKVKVNHVQIDKAMLISEGGDMVKLGLFLSMSSLISIATSYIVRVFVSHKGGVEQVGLYNAGFAIINTYVGMVFSAMSTDYFPRLSEIVHDTNKVKSLINQQSEVALLILAPILTVFLIFINWVVIILYSSRFLPVDNMIHWAALGIFFKAPGWALAYLIIAKGDSKLFFYSELIANVYMLGLNVVGYMLSGLEGLGLSFLVGYLLYLVQVFFIAKRKYSFTFQKVFVKIFGIQFALGVLCFSVNRYLPPIFMYIFGSLLIVLSSYYSIMELDKRLNIIPLIKGRFIKKR